MPIRLIIQRVEFADLVSIGKIGAGIMVYVSFMKNTEKSEISKCVEKLFNVELKERKTMKELGWELLIVPQASIAGKLRGKRFQYHSLIKKEVGEEFYKIFVEECKKKMDEEVGKPMVAGIFGNIQALEFKSPGPYTHCYDF